MMLLPSSEIKACERGENVVVLYGNHFLMSGRTGQEEGKVETMRFSCSKTGKGEVTFYPELVENIHSGDLCADCDIIKLTPPQ